jgi:hypothetical protein
MAIIAVAGRDLRFAVRPAPQPIFDEWVFSIVEDWREAAKSPAAYPCSGRVENASDIIRTRV